MPVFIFCNHLLFACFFIFITLILRFINTFAELKINLFFMKSTKVLIAEDQKNIEISLRNRLVKLGFDVIDLVDSPRKLIDVLDQRRADIVITDLFPGHESGGVNLAKVIREQYQTAILFLSSEQSVKYLPLFESINGITFLQKPAGDLELKINIDSAIENFKLSFQRKYTHSADLFNDYIFVRADYKLNRIRVIDIYFIEAKKDYITINTSDNVYTVHSTMRDIMNALPDLHFIRIHRSYIVNIDRIFSIKYPDLLVENKMKMLPIGGLYRKELFDKLNII